MQHHHRPAKYLSTPIEASEPLINYINQTPLPSIYPVLPSSAEEILHYNNLIAENR